MPDNKKIIDIIRDKRTQLPTLPVVASNVLKISSDENTSATDLAHFIKNDQALSNKLLRLANSAYYGLIKKVDSIHRAITVIGFNDVTSLAIGISVMSSFDLKKVEKILPMNDLWLHSICCATAAYEISKINEPRPDEYIFLNGLLHDMGKIIFAIHFPEEYAGVLEKAYADNLPLHRAEKELLDLDHAAIALHLMEQWNFPEVIRLPCGYHHNTAKCPADFKQKAMIIELADFISHKTGIGMSGTPDVEDIKKTALNLGLSADQLKKVAMELIKQRSKMEEFLKFIK